MVQKVNFNNLTGDTLTVGNTVITGTGVTVSGSPLSGGSGGATQYANTSQLPKQDLTFGEFALIGNTLFITNGVGWYSVGVINQSPSLSISVSNISLGASSNTINFTYTATDPDGPTPTVTASLVGANSSQANVNLYTSNSTVTVENLSATDFSANIVLTATDGIDQTFGTVTLTVAYISELWDETVLSIGTSSTDGLDNDTFIDRSTNTHTVTPSGTPIQTAFHPYLDNWSVEFDGNSSYLSVSNTVGDWGTGDFTIEAWVYNIGNGNILNSLISAYNGNNTQKHWSIQVDRDAEGNIYFYAGVTLLINSSIKLNKNEWTHIAVCRNSGTTAIYVNGQSGGSASDSTNYVQPSPIGIGSDLFSPSNYEFTGYISNLRLVKGTALYTSAFTPPTENLTAVSGTSLLICQSNRFIDNSSSAHTITPTGNVKVSAFNSFGQGSEYAVGENMGSIRFADGVNEKIEWVAFGGTNTGTIEFWMYPTTWSSSSGNQGIWSQGNYSPGIFLRNTGDTLDWYQGGNKTITYQPTAGQWIHVAYSIDNQSLSEYVNGVRTATASGAGFTNSINRLGTDGQSYFDGYISDFRMTYDVARYSGTTMTVPTSPVGTDNDTKIYLPMDNAGIFDKTGNYDLTLFGDTSTSTTQTKYADTAMYFDGTGDYILSGPNELYDRDFTIELWWYPTSTARQALMHGSWGNDWSIGIDYSSVSTNQKIGIWASSNGSSWNLINSDNGGNGIGSETINQNAWNHIAYTRSGTTWRLFVNGVLDVELTGISGSIARPTQQLAIGAWWSTGSLSQINGYIENFQILKGVAKYTTNFTPPTATQGRSYQAES